jgi:hypothetical protein
MMSGNGAPTAITDQSGKVPNYTIDYDIPGSFKITHQKSGKWIRDSIVRQGMKSKEHKDQVRKVTNILAKMV